jgi:Flp pilus assembly protein TadG
LNLVKSSLHWLFSEDLRRAQRHGALPLVAFYWNGSESVAHAVLNVSNAGLYLITKERWYPGTVVTMTLQRAEAGASDPERAITVCGRVVRSGADGVGIQFIWPDTQNDRRPDNFSAREADMKIFKGFFKRLRGDIQLRAERGQALVEYILLLPIVFLLIVNIVNFGGFFFAWITVANAARAGADYAILGFPSAGSPGTPTWSQIQSVITDDTSSLPNGSTISVNACQNFNGTVTALLGSGSTCSSIPADPEATNYVLTSIAVSYTYKPFIAAFQFPALGVYLTLPPTTITQTAVMRNIQ